uniref:Uncharacterized protein n=1 Tax=Amblyomma cajennense TaxID=34607 RepID=A0A023FE28_AMBCJ
MLHFDVVVQQCFFLSSLVLAAAFLFSSHLAQSLANLFLYLQSVSVCIILWSFIINGWYPALIISIHRKCRESDINCLSQSYFCTKVLLSVHIAVSLPFIVIASLPTTCERPGLGAAADGLHVVWLPPRCCVCMPFY